MRGRGTRRRSGGRSRPILGKRGRDRSVEPTEQELEGRRERGRPRGLRSGLRATGRRRTQRARSVSAEPRVTAVASNATENEILTLSKTSTSKSGPYRPDFRQHLIDHNVLPLNDYVIKPPEPPDNMREIKDAMNRERTWALDYDTKVQAFQAALRMAKNEYDIVALLSLESIPGDTILIRQSNIISRDQSWSGLGPLTDGNITAGKPDLAYATKANNLKQPIRNKLGAMILPTISKDVVCPNFMVAVKGPSGTQSVNDLQAVHVGALAARGMHALWSYGNDTGTVVAELETRKIARTITCTWLAGTLTMYATYRLDHQGAEDGSDCSTSTSSAFPTYCTSLIDSWAFNTDDNEKLKKGFAAYLNGLEWAQSQRDEAIERANRRYEAIKRANRMASKEKHEREQRRIREIEHRETQIQGTGFGEGQVDEGESVDGRSGDDEHHQNDPGEDQDLQQVTWSFNSADSQATITRSRAQRARMVTRTDSPQLNQSN